MHKAHISTGGKRWAVLGDIVELGTYAQAEHTQTGAALASLVDYIVAIGDLARFYVEGALEAGMPADHVYYFSADMTNKAELEAAKHAVANLLLAQVQPDDLVVLKASHAVGMDTLLAMLS